MAALLCEANEAAKTARAAGQVALPEPVLADLLARYRELVSQGFSDNLYRRTRVAGDAVRLDSYLSTAAKWGIDKLDALKQLFTTGRPWLPPALTPATAT
ncbi:hypothetical protein [Herbidospora mongoliensis]|uniref:hypothetical protein n=1 Tax=Herbidospora mongoliensis TaxID=688067 RepID=UPI00082BF9F1|nr:hypothetical protein [Herbidospora mongoliensis]